MAPISRIRPVLLPVDQEEAFLPPVTVQLDLLLVVFLLDFLVFFLVDEDDLMDVLLLVLAIFLTSFLRLFFFLYQYMIRNDVLLCHRFTPRTR